MANPRKFSEKIALHNQKQAEETAAFDAIMREVTATTRHAQLKQPSVQQMHLIQPQLGVYRGGSLPNVNQATIDLQGALHSLEDMKQTTGRQSLIDRYHRQRQVQTNRRSIPFDKRTDCSPYSTAYLSPPLDTHWRRTNSDSALHSTLSHQLNSIALPGDDAVLTNNLNIYAQHGRPKSCEVPGINIYPSPEQGQSIPISNSTGSLPDLTTIQFPSPLSTPLDEDDQHPQPKGFANPSNTHTVTSTQTPNHIGTVLSCDQSTSSNTCLSRTPPLTGTSPLILETTPSPMNTTGINNTSPQGLEKKVDQSLENCFHQYHPYSGELQHSPKSHFTPQSQSFKSMQYPATNLQRRNSSESECINCDINMPPLINSSHLFEFSSLHTHYSDNQLMALNNCHQQQTLPNTQVSHPQIVISSIGNDGTMINCETNENSPSPSKFTSTFKNNMCSEQTRKAKISKGSPQNYRNSQTDCPPSPNSPVSPHSYSPSQSPSLPTTLGGSPFSDNSYFIQQNTQATNALQHQFEQFNMMQENSGSGVYKDTSCISDLSKSHPAAVSNFSGNNQHGFSNLMQTIAIDHKNHHSTYFNSSSINQHSNIQSDSEGNVNSHCPHPPGSPQLPPSPQSPLRQGHTVSEISPTHIHQQEGAHANLSPQMSSHNHTKKIPDITFTGADDMLARQDFTKEISNAIVASMNEFDTELFTSDEALRIGLDPLDLDGLQMLTDPNMVTDPATEDTFRLDRL